MSRKILGLDIRRDSVAAVLVDSSLKGNRIETHEYVSISNSDYETPEQGLIHALEIITEKIDITGITCIASLPAEEFLFRNIQVPFNDKNKIYKVLPFELETVLPVAVDDLILDFQILSFPRSQAFEKETANDETEQSQLLSCALAQDRLQNYLETLAAFDLDPEVITVGGYPTARCIAKTGGLAENWLLIDISSNKTTLFAAYAQHVFVVRTLNASIRLKRPTVEGGRPKATVESLCREIKRTVLSFSGLLPVDFEPECIFVTGYQLSKLGVKDEMATLMELPVKQLNIGAVKGVLNADFLQPAEMNNALSLVTNQSEGISYLNFRRGEFAPKKKWLEYKDNIVRTGITLCIVLFLALLTSGIDIWVKDKKVREVTAQISQIFKDALPGVRMVKATTQLEQHISKLEKAPAMLEGAGDYKRVIDILYDISSLVSKEIDVNLSRLVIRPGDVLITGDTDTNLSVNNIKTQLEKSKIFKVVTIANSNQDKGRYRFKLKVEF